MTVTLWTTLFLRSSDNIFALLQGLYLAQTVTLMI